MITVVKVNDIQDPLFFKPSPLALKWCKGDGVELGAAAHNSFSLPGSINVAPQDDEAFYRDAQIAVCGSYAVIDHYGDANHIPVEDNSQDYVISSHVIEHVPDPLSAFQEWNRVLRPGGIVFMIFPNRNALPSDQNRPIVPLEEYVRGHESDRDIPADWHVNVFTLQSMLELIEWGNQHLDLGWTVVETEETDTKVGNGHTVVCSR